MRALRRGLLLLVAAGVAGAWLRRRLGTPPPELPPALPGPLELEASEEAPAGVAPTAAPAVDSPLEMGPVTDEMNAIPLPLEEELAMLDAAEPEPAALVEEKAEPEVEQAEEPESRAEPATEQLARVETGEAEVRRVTVADSADGPEPLDIVAVVDDLLERSGD